jgi:hypothetical protein
MNGVTSISVPQAPSSQAADFQHAGRYKSGYSKGCLQRNEDSEAVAPRFLPKSRY